MSDVVWLSPETREQRLRLLRSGMWQHRAANGEWTDWGENPGWAPELPLLAGFLLASQRTADQPSPPEPRFGERLRLHDWSHLPEGVGDYLRGIADAIDRDQEGQCARLVQRRLREQADLRRKIEQLVEELRYGSRQIRFSGPEFRPGEVGVDVLDADPFLERLGEIFEGGG